MWRILFLLLLIGTSGSAQDYKITYSTQAFNIWSNFSSESAHFEIVTNIEAKAIDGDGMLIIRGRPETIEVKYSFLDVDEFGDIIYECQPPAQEINLSSTDCFSYANSNFSTTCTRPVYINVDITPVLTFSSGTTLENNESNSTPYCISDPIRLAAQSGFSSYKWEYRVLGESWKSFNPGSGNDVTFSLKNVLGSQADYYLNKTIFFRYNVGNCSSSTVSPSKQYVFTIPPPNVVSLNILPPTCVDGNNGSISVVALDRALLSGENITYSLNNNGVLLDQKVSGIFNGLNSGVYYVSIQPISSAYCSTPPALKQANIINPSKITINVTDNVSVSCYGSNTGSLKISPSGGSGVGYSFSVDGGNFNSSSTFSSLSGGGHNISVKDSKGCIESKSILVSGPSASLNSFITITSDYNGESLSCGSSSDASINISASGGWGGYSFSRSQNGIYTTSSSFNNIGAGSITFWIKDSKGCIISQEVLISPPQKLIVNNVSINQPSCLGEFASIAANTSGGTGTILYSIDNLNFQPSQDFNLTEGNYQAYAKDINGCVAIGSPFSIVDPPEITFSINKTDITCRDISDGSIIFQSINNGTAPYQYSIDEGVNYSTSSTFPSLSSGNYNVIVKDSKGCISSSFVFVGEPISVTGSIFASTVSCNGDANGTLTVTGTGGAGGYKYLWSNGSSSHIISNLNSGNYNVIITDQMGCASQPIIYILVEPTPILITPIPINVNGYNVSCNGSEDGQIDLLISGGTISNDYQYTWSNGHNGNSLVGVSTGEYQIIVTDDNGCSASETVEVTEPEILVFENISINNVSCNGGSDGELQISVAGGVGGYLYSLNGSQKGSSTVFNGLVSGDYFVEVQDLNGCKRTKLITINEPIILNVQEETLLSTLCGQANGLVDINVSGGVMPYVFKWTNSSNELISSAEDLTAVNGGTYSLLVTDDNGCNKSITTSIPNSDGPIIQTDFIEGTSCFDSDDGKAKISVMGGIPPYEINWANGEVGYEAISLIKGDVEISVKDASGCVSFLLVSIPGNSSIEVDDIIIKRPSCYFENDGSIEIIASEGVAPLSYSWSNGLTGATVNMLTSGDFDLTIVDAIGCQIVEVIKLGRPEPLIMVADIKPPTCENGGDGSAVLSVSGGTDPYQIFLDGTIQSTMILDQLKPGTYSVEVIDSNSCTIVSALTISDPEPWIFDFDDITICEGQEVNLTSPGNAFNSKWYLNNDLISSNNALVVSKAGEYVIIVTNSLGCSGQATFLVTTSTEALNADFLISSTATAGDTLIVIDITYPIPDSITWIAPIGAEIIESTNDYALFIIGEPGIYNFGFDTYLGLCQDYYSSTIEIFDNDEIPINGRISGESRPMISSLEVYPNPTDGFFMVEGTLREANTALVRLISLSNNQVVLDEVSPVNLTHSLNFELPNLAKGTYALVFESGGEVKVVRMIKQ